MIKLRLVAPALLAGSLALVPAAAAGHTDLSSSDPADGATLTEPPSEVVLTFEEEIGEASTFTVSGSSGETVGEGELDLDVADRNVLRGDVTVGDPGEYTVAYSIIGEDGDPIEGEVRFTYAPSGSSGAGGEAPDTAMEAPRVPTLTLIGVLLLALAGLTVVRHRIVRG